MRRWQRRWIFRSGSEKKTLFENKNDSPFLTTKDEKWKKSFWEQQFNLQFCSTWEVINSPVDTFSEMLARPGLTSEQVTLPENKVHLLRTKCFSWKQTSFPENKVLFLENKVFSWEQSIFPENKVLVIDQGLTKTCSPGEALPRHQTPWEEQSGRSELQEEEARHNRRTAKPSWTGGRPGLAQISNSFSFSNSFWLKTKDYCNNLYWATWTFLRAF